MDEQRMAAYVELIEQGLGCEQGLEGEVLQANAELVDAGLVGVMGQYADWLESQGNGNTAGWLRNFAGQLAQDLGMAGENSMAGVSGDVRGFWVEIVQLIAQTQGNRMQVYEFFRANLGRLDQALLAALPEVFENLIQQNDVAPMTTIFARFGNLIQQFPLGNRMLNLELGISAYELVLQVYTRDAFLEDWAMTQNNLATAYKNRIQGERADNIERAIAAYEFALQVYTRDAFPEDWAMTQNNLANAYYSRIRGERADNIERAIALYELALQVRTCDAFPERWAATQNNLAIAYKDRIRGERADNIELAINAFELALQVRTRDTFPEDWAMTQNNLASAYYSRIRGERADNIERAINAFELALQVRTRDTFPEDWMMTQNNLASAYKDRIRGERADNVERAINAFELVLQVRTRDAFPENWAATQNNLAIAYSDRIRGERADNIERAINAFELALQVRTRDAFPEDWAMTQNNLANAYKNRIRGGRADNIERAINTYELALQVYTHDAFPEDWAMTQNNLASAYSDRIRGERADNIERAINAFELALQVYTRDAFPENWAATQNNLANSYSDRIRGERADNIELAINAFELALQVRTRDTFPEDWAMTQNNLASTYYSRIRGERADNIERAINAFELALQEVYTRHAFPENWATTQNNLAGAYSRRIRGDKAENIEQATVAYKKALQVLTQEALPGACRQTARSLGNLHFDRKDWKSSTEAYDKALAAAEILYQSCILLDGQTAELRETIDLARRATYAHSKIGNLEEAILTIETYRARGLTESLNRNRTNLDQLQQLAPELYTKYKDTTNQLRNLEAQQRDRMTSSDRHSITPEALRETATNLREQLTTLIEEIRQVPRYEKFLKLPTFDEIRGSVTNDQPLIYLVTTSEGALALILKIDTIESIWLNEFKDQKLIDLLSQTWFAAYNNSQDDRQSWYNAIDTTTRQLWEPLMEPLIEKLKAMGFDRATLIPTGLLSLLPLHAAWTEDSTKPTGRRYAIDDIHFTYATNARSLIAAKQIADRIQPITILAIDNPRKDLPNSEREIKAAIETFQNPIVLRHSDATIKAVKKELTKAAIVHFSCHGTANLNDPLNSGLLMSDGLLTLKDILALNLAKNDRGIRLAILSACETGMIGIENADEAISLPTGLLQAGVAAVIASLWSVSDLSTMLLLTKFYDLWREQKLPADQALRQAQIWLRDTTNREKLAHFKANSQNVNGFNTSAENAEFLRNRIMDLDQDRDDRSFSHPFHWAAFYYTGI